MSWRKIARLPRVKRWLFWQRYGAWKESVWDPLPKECGRRSDSFDVNAVAGSPESGLSSNRQLVWGKSAELNCRALEGKEALDVPSLARAGLCLICSARNPPSAKKASLPRRLDWAHWLSARSTHEPGSPGRDQCGGQSTHAALQLAFHVCADHHPSVACGACHDVEQRPQSVQMTNASSSCKCRQQGISEDTHLPIAPTSHCSSGAWSTPMVFSALELRAKQHSSEAPEVVLSLRRAQRCQGPVSHRLPPRAQG